MKKYIALLLALCLLTAGCGKKQEAPTAPPASTAAPSTEATEPEPTTPETTAPKTSSVRVMGDNIPVIRALLKKGTSLEVTGYDGSYAKGTAPEGEGLVQTQFLRFPDEVFEPFTGYAMWNAGLYTDFTCLGEPTAAFGTNTKLEVLEELDDCYFVSSDGKSGFVPKAQVSKYPIQPSTDEGGSSGGSGGSGPQDGGDITMGRPFGIYRMADAVKTGQAQAKVDGIPLVLRFCAYGETVAVLESGGAPELPGYTAILESDDSTAYIPTAWLESSRSFTPWDGYAGGSCKLFDNPTLSGKEVTVIYTNKPLTVLWDTGTAAFVQVEEKRYFAASATLRDTPVPAAPEDSSGGSGGSGGSSDLWTPPVL